MAYDSDQFHEHGWARIRGAFSAAAAAAMRDAVWRTLEGAGMHRDRPSSWTMERPPNLQQLKSAAVFQQVGSRVLLAAIEAIFEGRPYEPPKNWGAIFLVFPTTTPWALPARGWHIDANYASPLWPARGVKTFALLGNVVPRGGATLLVSGSHRLVHRWFQQNPPPRRAHSAAMRSLLLSQPYLRDLHRAGEARQRIERFMDGAEDVGGIPLQIVEATGDAGDVILVHPLVMHVAATNNSPEPRFMLSGGVTTDMWGWHGELA
jgi:hypothetical protein